MCRQFMFVFLSMLLTHIRQMFAMRQWISKKLQTAKRLKQP